MRPETSSNLRVIPGTVPPHSVELEEAVLGGILIDPIAVERIADLLPVEAFYFNHYQEIYRAALALYHESFPVDMTTIAQRLHAAGVLSKVGGQAKLVDLMDAAVHAVNIDFYAQALVQKWKRRQLIQICREVAAQSHDENNSWTELMDSAQQKIFNLTESSRQKGLRPLSEIMIDEYLALEARMANKGLVGTSTGFYDLDALTGGLKPNQLIICAGRPSMGKSALAGTIALNVAQQGKTVAIFSLEMNESELARRFWAANAGVNGQKIQSASLDESELAKVSQSLADLSPLSVHIDEGQDVSPEYILNQSRRIAGQGKELGLVAIDYLHLMADGSAEEVRQLGVITRACKKMARQLGAPVLLLSQLSRAVEAQANKRPAMKDLRGSGAIEQDADMILLLYRDEYYNPDTPDRGIAEVIVAKNRNGATGTVKLLFQPEYTRFLNIARGRYE